ncbi:single-stranded DNA-binding protein [Saccharothrix variisporea]|uniref:Single-stranded DNA-binding protein n=1 Tax=Saccharothrix variisporea TaxID=543527 RepID=A0A495X918_9PSEU|nr:single-stranded DNA-binding protein [Saccharothrix variisporea]RKT69364.1 single-strand DNA-binding protein [Saccharothrix variisporea]
MAGEITLTVIGRLTADPELRFTQAGTPVSNFTIASNPRTFDRGTGEWRDADAVFLRCTCWKQLAENTAASLHRGSHVIAHGRLRQRTFEKDGVKHTIVELDVDEIGAALRFATVTITKPDRAGTRAEDTAGDLVPVGPDEPNF